MCSVGLHPWYLEGIDLDLATLWLREQAISPGNRAIGEISESFKKPLIIHCVRAFSEVIALKKAWKPAQIWIFHGFDKNLPTTAMLLRAGCYLSFGAALFKPQSHAAESLLASPADRFFLETDDAGITIKAVYERAAFLRGVGLKKLEDLMEENFLRFF